jgi:plastocyanin
LFCAFLLLASCSKGDADNNSPSLQTPVIAASAIIQNNAFSPATIYLKTGGSVSWTNLDRTLHAVTGQNGNFESKPLAENQSFLYKFSTPGTYLYHCPAHPNTENGKVIVTN